MTTNCTCTVTSCMHNSDRCCCKSTILVDGKEAHDKEKTCCASFDERTHDSFKNHYETPDKKLQIECNAMHCMYNTNRYCTADHVDINPHGASGMNDTQCATFKMR